MDGVDPAYAAVRGNYDLDNEENRLTLFQERETDGMVMAAWDEPIESVDEDTIDHIVKTLDIVRRRT